ncbi:MAG: hypothetical protein U0T81_03725 [Saprospiraceae bacterium]
MISIMIISSEWQFSTWHVMGNDSFSETGFLLSVCGKKLYDEKERKR